MSQDKPLTKEELERMGIQRAELAIAAIDAGDMEGAKKRIRGGYNEFFSMHGILRDWIAAIYSYVYTRQGDEALYQLNHAVCSFWMKGLVELYPKETPPRQAAMLAAGFRGHLLPLKVEEDEEKFTITMTPCGSGGKLVLEGGYKPPRNLARVKKAQPQTFGKENFPVYCTHCAFQEIIPIEVLGYPLFITDPPDGDKIGEVPCPVYIYKDIKNIPERFYERFGKKKPV